MVRPFAGHRLQPRLAAVRVGRGTPLGVATRRCVRCGCGEGRADRQQGRPAPDAGACGPGSSSSSPRVDQGGWCALRIAAGAKLRLRARLAPPPPMALPGSHDFARDAWFRGLGAVGRALGDVQVLRPMDAGGLDSLRYRLGRHILRSFPVRRARLRRHSPRATRTQSQKPMRRPCGGADWHTFSRSADFISLRWSARSCSSP